MRRVVIIALFIISISAISQESNIKFKHLSVDDGLSHNYVTSILRDSYGYLWVGTGNSGINKYDGNNFVIYKYDSKDSNSISHNTINVIYEDNDSNIWVCTQNELNYFNREQNKFIRINTGIQNLVGIYRNKDNSFFLCSSANFFYLKLGSLPEQIHNDLEGTSSDYYSGQFIPISDKELLIPTRKGVLIFDMVNRTFKKDNENYTNYLDIANINASAVFKDDQNRIWIGTENIGLFQGKIQNHKIIFENHFENHPNIPSSISEGSIKGIQIDLEGNIWLANFINGVNVARYDDLINGVNKFTRIESNSQNIYSLSNNSLNTIFIDDEGTSWLGSFTGGVDYYNPVIFKFDHYNHNPNTVDGLNSSMVNVIFKDDKYLWIATDIGLNQYNLVTETWDYFQHDINNPNSLSASGIWAIVRDMQNRLWVGMWGGGINMYNESNRSFTHYLNDPNDPTTISSNNVFGMAVDDQGIIWVATMGGGLNKFNPKTEEFKSFNNTDSENNILTTWTKYVLFTRYDEIWVATGAGIDVINRKTEEISNFVHEENDSGSISSNGIVILFEDSKGTEWAGTEYGLNRFNRKQGTFTVFTEDDGLANNVVRGILEDDQGNLWISTNNGLSQFVNAVNNPDTIKFLNYNADDGLQGNGFNSRACFKSDDGKLYFGGSNGFNVFDPASIRTNKHVPDIILTDFQLFNKSVEIGTENSPLKKDISLTNKIVLKYDQSVLRFEYTALNLLVSEKNQYAYMMEGFDDDWNYVGDQKFATYTNLDPGKYIFRVKGSNNDGIWNEEGTSLTIQIKPPWWRTIVFYVFAIIFISALVLFVIKKRNEIIKRDKRILEGKIKEGEAFINKQKQEVEKQREEIKQRDIEEKEIRFMSDGLAKFSELISKNQNDFKKLMNTLASELTAYVSANMGVIYLSNEDKEDEPFLELTGVFAADKGTINNKRIEVGEGCVGTCYKDAENIIIDNVSDEYIKLESGLGQSTVKIIYCIPLKQNEMVTGVLELGSFEKLEEYKIRFLERIAESISSAIAIRKYNVKTQKMLELSKAQAEEMMAHEEEMRQNLEELVSTQEEMSRKQDEWNREKDKLVNEIKELKNEYEKLQKEVGDN